MPKVTKKPVNKKKCACKKPVKKTVNYTAKFAIPVHDMLTKLSVAYNCPKIFVLEVALRELYKKNPKPTKAVKEEIKEKYGK